MKLRNLVLLSSIATAAHADIVINEIMYHPLSENPLQEYIELKNTGAAAVDVSGWAFTSGVSFTIPAATPAIPAGGYLVVAANGAAFTAKYPTVTNYVAGWVGQLSNSSNNIVLKNVALVEMDKVKYADDGDWADRTKDSVIDNGHYGWTWKSLADGNGKSLELISATFDNSQGQVWGSSTTAEGTPGVGNSIVAANVAPVIREVAHSPLIPKSTDAVTVTARIVDELTTGLTVTLRYREDGAAAFDTATMFDDGAHSDALAGDGVFGATIPTKLNGVIVEFYVTAADAAANSRNWPKIAQDYNTGTSTFFASQATNCLYQVDNTVYSGAMPIYRMVMRAADAAELATINNTANSAGGSHAKMNATFVTIDGTSTELRYNCAVRNRGHGSAAHDPQGFHISIPNDYDWKGKTALNLNTFYTYLQLFGSALMRKADLPCFDSRQVQVRINAADLTQAGGLSADGGHSYYFYVCNEVEDTNYTDHHFPLDGSGNIYSVRRSDTTSQEGDFSYLGATPASYAPVYFKDTNVSENVWTDLINMTEALSHGVSTTMTNVSYTPNSATYATNVSSKINVAEWMRWFAAENLLGNNETNLSGGYGDDFYLYFGALDQKAHLLPHDLDTILGHGDQNSGDAAGFGVTDSLVQMMSFHGNGTAPTVLNAFIRHPNFAPIFWQAHLDLINGPMAIAQFNTLADQLLTGVVGASVITNRKTWYASRVAYVASQIPTTISGIVAATTGGTTLATSNGYARSTAATCKLSGFSHAGKTRTVKVNGTLVTWDAFNATWTANPLALNPGLNRFKIESFDATGAEFEEVITDVWYDDASVASASGALPAGTTTWTPAGGPYQVTAALTVPATGTLIIQPGTTVYLASTISVTAGGKILAEGTEAQPIRFSRPPASATNGGTITINGTAGAPETHFYYTYFEFGGNPAITATTNSNIVVDHCEFGRTDAAYIHLDGGSFLVSHCLFPTATAGFEPLHGTIGIPAGGRGIVRDSFFGKALGYNDVFDYTSGNRAAPILQFINNVCIGSDDDVLDLDGTDTWAEGNIFLNVHRSPASPDSSSAVSGGNDGGARSMTAINTATEQVTCGTHGFTTGQEVAASSSQGGAGFPVAIPALRNGSYFVRVISTTVVKLYLTDADANADTNAVNFTGATGSLALTGMGTVSHVTVVGNLFNNVDQAATAKQGNFFTFLNNTVVNQNGIGSQDTIDYLTSSDPNLLANPSLLVGVLNFADHGIHEAGGMYVEGNIIHSASALVRNYPGAGLTQNVVWNNNILPVGMTWTGAGSGNTNIDPLLNNVKDPVTNTFNIPTPTPRDFERMAASIRQQFGLQSVSPGKGTGPNGKDKGGIRPLGVSISGVPSGTTNATTATVVIGTRMTGNGISTAPGAWPGGGSGWTHYKYRLDGAAYSAEIVNSAPISLTGLTNGVHTLDVIGKNDAGFYQNDAAFGTSAITTSATWTVNTAYVPPATESIRINEVLASNTDGASFSGIYPDMIELRNVGLATVDISGWGLTDNTALPFKYTIPATTTIAPGAYLIIYATTSTAVPLPRTGFSVKQSGDDLTLTKSVAAGGGIADSIVWGQQINDLSIGRAADGSWALCNPTFNAANVLASKAPITFVKINEWLADAVTLFGNDFVELYNPATLPVELGGSYLTDNPSEYPNKHAIAPLTFLSAAGYISFKADGDTAQGPDHLNFKLSPLQGEIGFFSSALALVDNVIYGPQRSDFSEGRSPNGSAAFAAFTQPTPGAPNPGNTGTAGTTNVSLLGATKTWKYYQSATAAPSNDTAARAWSATAYDDAQVALNWNAAAAQVLHIEPDALTAGALTEGFAKTTLLTGFDATHPYQTYYFRTHFTYSDSLSGVVLTAKVISDDGCVIYLNGQRVKDLRVATDPALFLTKADSTTTDGTVETFTIPTTYLVNGDNVLAVSVHQSSASNQSISTGSSDIAFGMKLDAAITSAAGSSPIAINEVLPVNVSYQNPDSSYWGWIELYNTSASAVSLADYSLTNEIGQPRKFVFPSGSVPANGYLVVYCNPLTAVSATNTAFALNGAGDQIYLFKPTAVGAGLQDSVIFGQQLPDFSVARIANGVGAFALGVPTRGAINSAAATTSITNVKLNEWLTNPVVPNPSWFELYNNAAQPVLLSGNYLTDQLTNKTKHLIPPLTFIGGTGAARWLQQIADNDNSALPNHVNFTLDPGEGLGLFTATGTTVDTIASSTVSAGASQGRLADGTATISALLPTPGAANLSANTDTDGDGIPDIWENANGLNPNVADSTLDPDGDGQNNKAEYLAGTNPLQPGSRLAASVAKIAVGQYAVTFTAIAGKGYTVRYKDDLTTATWTTLQQISAQASDTVMTINDTPGTTKRFYQIVTPQQP